MILVADASAVGSFLLPDEAGAFADFAREACTNNDVYAPPHWPVEIANILWKAQRRKRIGPEDLSRIVRVASELASIVVLGAQAPIDAITKLTIDLGLTAYDAAYLWQAQTLGAALLTTDCTLRRVAREQSVEVLLP